MLTNKDIIESLVNVGYTLKEISSLTKLSNKTLNKMKKNEEVSEEEESIINNFFRMNIKEVEISKFSDEDFRNNNLIMTPTGFKKVLEYKEEGLQHCFELKLNGCNNIASDKHKIQLQNDTWITLDKVKKGDKVKLFDENVEVTAVNEVGDYNCCSIVVDGDEYYLDGVVSK